MKIYSVDRKTVIRDRRDLSVLDNLTDAREFHFAPSRHGYFIVELLLHAEYDAAIAVETRPLEGEDGKKFEKAVTCFNSAGVGADGKKFERKVAVTAGRITPLFIGVDLSRASICKYRTDVVIDGESVSLVFDLSDKLVFNEGMCDGDGLSRLKWLNSTDYMDKRLLPGFNAVSADKNSVSFTGKRAYFTGDGFLGDVESYYSESNALTDEVTASLFTRPMEFLTDGQKIKYNRIKITDKPDSAVITSDGRSEKLHVTVEARAHYEGVLRYSVKVDALDDVIVDNIRLCAYFACADFVAGMGAAPGAFTDIKYDWNTPGYDTVFVGNVNCGARIRFRNNRGENDYPVYGAYAETCAVTPSETWANFGKGGVTVSKTEEGAELCAYTGKMVFAKGDAKEFLFDIHLTPFMPVDLKKSLGTRVYHIGADAVNVEFEKANAYRANAVSAGVPSDENKYVKNALDDIEGLKKLSLESHKRNLAFGLSYGSGVLTDKAKEYHAFKAFDGEILFDEYRSDLGEFGHVVPGSRYDNFYVESLKHLIDVADIDFVSLDNPSLTPVTAERIQKCMTRKRGGGFTELVANNRSELPDGATDTLLTYADILPFVSGLVVKGFTAEQSLDYSLMAMSGVPYGITSRCHAGYGICRALLAGMLPDSCADAEEAEAVEDINKLFADFDIGNAELKGYWDKTNPVSADNANVYCTSYINGKNMIAVIYNDSDKKVTFEVGVENKLGFTTVGKKVRRPEIRNMQKGRSFNIGKAVKLGPKSGVIVSVIAPKKK